MRHPLTFALPLETIENPLSDPPTRGISMRPHSGPFGFGRLAKHLLGDERTAADIDEINNEREQSGGQ